MNMVLVVDDKELMRDSVGATLKRAGFGVVTASSGEQAVSLMASRRPDAVVTDLKMPGMTGIELLERVREIDDELPVVMMTAFGDVETAVSAIKLGAFDYITKPFEGDELVVAIKRAIEHGRIRRENAVLRHAATHGALAAGDPGLRGAARLIGESPAMRRVREQVAAVAESQGTVLIYGESGTGKEAAARAVHELSPRGGEVFLAVNCASLSETLLESELFGHERGAFTGAEKMRKGRFELADGGTILLDEISEIDTRVQAKLLRVLQERCFERVGSSVSISVDVRVVATSNRDLPRSVAAGEFRQDLFFRLNVLPIHLPPLRDRLEDVHALADHFLGLVAAREGRPVKRLDEEAVAAMRSYPWPGNVRELQNICERAAVLSAGEVIPASLIRSWLAADPGATSGPAGSAWSAADHHHADASGFIEPHHRPNGTRDDLDGAVVSISGRPLEDIEREAIVQTLLRFEGHRQRTAQSLGIGVRTLGLKLKKWKEQNLVAASI